VQQVISLEQNYELRPDIRINSKKEFTLQVKEKNLWDGVQLVYQFNQDDVYFTELEVIPNSKNVLLEIILPTKKKEIRIKSFVLDSPKKIQFAFSPMYDANSISLRISSYGDYSTGRIEIKKLKTSNLFPIVDHDDLIKKIKLLGSWFHQINLDGIKTRLVNSTDSPSRPDGFTEYFTEQDFIDNPIWIWSKFKDSLPELKGLNVLDVACNAGFYSFELAKKGANVVGIDNSYEDIVKAKFAKRIIGIKNINFEIVNVDDVNEELNQKFDLVLCLGLLYHVEDPKLVINKIANLGDIVIFETIANVNSQEEKLINDRLITSDGYVPTVPWLKNAFREAGFTEITQITDPNFPRVVFKCRKNLE
jgi:tRNA (mo5U34)-methyltransferase